MRPTQYDSRTVKKALRRLKIATMEQVKEVLSTNANMTVIRKLRELGYITSYSHNGKYYTSKDTPEFDEQGLWSWEGVWFSVHGTLKATASALVQESTAGYYVSEIDQVLHVSTKRPLIELVGEQKLGREMVSGRYVYLSGNSKSMHKQLRMRRMLETDLILAHGLRGVGVVSDQLKEAMMLVYGQLDEKQRRVYAGFESLRWGRGGDRRVARLLGIDSHTVARGRRELVNMDVELEGTRRKGAGRPSKKNDRSDG